MSVLGWIHTGSSVLALLFGLVVLMQPKGTRAHRQLGWAYVASMSGLIVTAFMIYDLFGGFGPFHFAALVALITLVGGMLPAYRRRPRQRWVERHYYGMTWSYVGLLAAAAAETLSRLPDVVFWWGVIGASLIVALGGGIVIARKAGDVLRPFRRGEASAGAAAKAT